MRMPIPLMAALAAPALLGAGVAAPLAGTWGAGDAQLILGPTGGRLVQGCALVLLDPVRPDASGRFSVQGSIATLDMRPPQESADETVTQAAETRPATISGIFAGDRLTLDLTVAGEAPRRLSLVLGQRVRLARCL
jgi:hypothetical protein